MPRTDLSHLALSPRAGCLHCQPVGLFLQSLPLLLATSRNVRNPACFKEERAQQVECKGGDSVCSVSRAVEVLVHLTGAVWRVGAAPPAAHVAGL